jgi:hypothetical protein
MYLDIPLRMSGQPGLYKMPREICFGARDKLKKSEYSWWPPEQFKNLQIGQFDIYPNEYAAMPKSEIMALVEKRAVSLQKDYRQLSAGCFYLKNFLDTLGQ